MAGIDSDPPRLRTYPAVLPASSRAKPITKSVTWRRIKLPGVLPKFGRCVKTNFLIKNLPHPAIKLDCFLFDSHLADSLARSAFGSGSV